MDGQAGAVEKEKVKRGEEEVVVRGGGQIRSGGGGGEGGLAVGVDRAGDVLRILGLGALQGGESGVREGGESGVRDRGDASFPEKFLSVASF